MSCAELKTGFHSLRAGASGGQEGAIVTTLGKGHAAFLQFPEDVETHSQGGCPWGWRLSTGEVWGPPILVGGRLRVTVGTAGHQLAALPSPTRYQQQPLLLRGRKLPPHLAKRPWALEKPAGTSALSDTKARGERRAGSPLLLAAHEESQENHKEKEQQPTIPSSLTSYEVSLRVLLCLLNKCRSFPVTGWVTLEKFLGLPGSVSGPACEL